MAVTKRLRFEILKRDGFRCYYCGTRGNETGEGLTIDHVVPVALGGSDDAANLVAACRDCNAGKSSVPADADVVEDVDRMAALYAQARAVALRALQADMDAETDYIERVWGVWEEYAPSYVDDPDDLESIASTWYSRGVPMDVVGKAFRISWGGPAGKTQKMRYAAGVVNKIMEGAEDRTRAIVAGEHSIWNNGYYTGYDAGTAYQQAQDADRDLLALHIDGRRSHFWELMSGAA